MGRPGSVREGRLNERGDQRYWCRPSVPAAAFTTFPQRRASRRQSARALSKAAFLRLSRVLAFPQGEAARARRDEAAQVEGGLARAKGARARRDRARLDAKAARALAAGSAARAPSQRAPAAPPAALHLAGASREARRDAGEGTKVCTEGRTGKSASLSETYAFRTLSACTRKLLAFVF